MARTVVEDNRKVMRNACVWGVFQTDDKLAFRAATNYINSSAASTLQLVGASTIAINAPSVTRTGTITKGIDFTSSTMAASADNAFFACGTYTSAKTVVGTVSYIPIQVNLSSTGNMTAAGSQVAAARFRVDSDTNAQNNTAINVLQLRSDIGTNVYFASCINASLNISADMTVGGGTVHGFYVKISGNKTITCSNAVSVIEAVHSVSAGGGVDNVLYGSNEGAATITSIINATNWGGATATNGLYITGAGTLTNGVTIDHSCSKFLNITGTIAAGANNRAISSVTTMAVAAFDDGYGANEFDFTTTGAATGHQACMSVWVNATSGDPAGSGSYVVPITTGVYETASYTPTAQKIVTGMRMQGVLAETGYTSLSCFSINMNQAMTGFIECDYSTDNGVTVGTASVGPTVGYFKLLCNAAGTATRYVRLFASTT